METDPDLLVDVGAQWIGPTHTELLHLIGRYDLSPFLVEQYYDPLASPPRLTECVGFQQTRLERRR